MSLSVERGTARRVMRNSQGFTLQIQVKDDASQEAAEMALERLRIIILRTGATGDIDYEPGFEAPGANFVSEVARLPGGPFMYVDAQLMPTEELGKLPGLLHEFLDDLGVTNATIRVPGYDELNLAARAGRLREALALVAVPSPEHRYDVEMFSSVWIDIAESWLLENCSSAVLEILLGTVTFTVDSRQAQCLLRQFASRDGIRIASIAGSTVRVVDFQTVGARRLALAVGQRPGNIERPDIDLEAAILMTALGHVASEGAFGFLSVETNLANWIGMSTSRPRWMDR
jgi:hypothetical protein